MNPWTTNPYDWTEETKLELMQETCFYWMQRSNRLSRENEAIIEILEENKIYVTLKDLMDTMNKIALEREWEKDEKAKTPS